MNVKYIHLCHICASIFLSFTITLVQGDCGDVPSVGNSHHSAGPGPTYPSGNSVTFTCNHGYVPTGDNTITCNGDTWDTPEITCSIRVCGDPGSPDNGRRIGTLYQFGSSVTFECYEGYILDGLSEIYCQTDGTWSRENPTCNVVTCGPFEQPTHGSVFPTTIVEYDETVRFTCDQGFMWTGTKERKCQADGSLSGQDGSCEEARCANPTGFLLAFEGSTKAGESIMFTCQEQSTMVGDEFAMCLESTLQWSIEPPKCYSRTQAPSNIPHGTWNSPQWTRHGDSANMQCDEGYRGPSTVVSNNGTWNPEPICERIVCPSLSNPSHSSAQYTDQNYVGSVVQFTCDDGYKWKGNNNLRCESSGQWEPRLPGSCERVCPFPSTPSHGSTKYTNQNNLGSVITFTCDSGFKWEGNNNLHCESSGQWEPRPSGSCEKILCPEIQVTKFMNIDPPDAREPGMTVKISCSEEYVYTGSPALTCGSDGVWIGQQGKCSDGHVEPDATWKIIVGVLGAIGGIAVIAVIVFFGWKGYTQKKKKQRLSNVNAEIPLDSARMEKSGAQRV